MRVSNHLDTLFLLVPLHYFFFVYWLIPVGLLPRAVVFLLVSHCDFSACDFVVPTFEVELLLFSFIAELVYALAGGL